MMTLLSYEMVGPCTYFYTDSTNNADRSMHRYQSATTCPSHNEVDKS